MSNGAQNFKNPNLLQPERDQASAESNTVTLSIRCPHCLHIGAFTSLFNACWGYNKTAPHPTTPEHVHPVRLFAAIHRCPNDRCRGIVLIVRRERSVLMVMPPERLDFIPDGIPAPLVATMQEAVTCHASGAYRASALMVRRLMEELCHELGATGPNLHQRLLALQKKMTLSGDLIDGAMVLKALGNDAAHVEAKAYTAIGPEEAELSIQVAKEILKALYQHKGLIERLQKLQAAP